jgi:hypothetical protein
LSVINRTERIVEIIRASPETAESYMPAAISVTISGTVTHTIVWTAPTVNMNWLFQVGLFIHKIIIKADQHGWKISFSGSVPLYRYISVFIRIILLLYNRLLLSGIIHIIGRLTVIHEYNWQKTADIAKVNSGVHLIVFI